MRRQLQYNDLVKRYASRRPDGTYRWRYGLTSIYLFVEDYGNSYDAYTILGMTHPELQREWRELVVMVIERGCYDIQDFFREVKPQHLGCLAFPNDDHYYLLQTISEKRNSQKVDLLLLAQVQSNLMTKEELDDYHASIVA